VPRRRVQSRISSPEFNRARRSESFSGLYELFPSNEPVLTSLRGLADAIEPGGYLIYTNQPWHPQLEFIAQVLTNREGERWIMRRRTTAEMDELVRVAGFERSIWKSISGGCSLSQSHDARSFNHRVHVSRLKAFTVSAELSVLFLVVYSGCNWITGQRSHVGSFYFQWEHAIPFVPLMILPYMSIDLFFIAAPFLCRTEEELRTFSRRVIAAILIAGLCFLLFPLRFAFPAPSRERVARRGLRLVSRSGFAI